MTETNRSITFRQLLLDRNTLLVSGFGLIPALLLAVDSVSGATTGVLILLITLTVYIFASLTRRFLSGFGAILVYLVAASALSSLAALLIMKTDLGYYERFAPFLLLIGICPVCITGAFLYGRSELPRSVYNACAAGFGYGLAVTVYGILRELLAEGSLCGVSLFKGIGFFSTAAGAIVLLACLCALFKAIINKANEYEDDVIEQEKD
ncbi:MAG TPA: Rnf-Nqr domain containing protein [Bacillota bacterium]|nr:Rnf-Nqr domain containing protein [Bacillota bacterium]